MVRVLSEDLKARMQMARKRKELGYTRHLEIAGEMARKKIEGLFDEWDIEVEGTLFHVTAMDWKFEVLWDKVQNDLLQAKELQFKDIVSKAVEFLARRKVSEIGIWSSDKVVGGETEETGNVVFIRKIKLEYLIESYKEWNERIGGKANCPRCAKLRKAREEAKLGQS